MKAFNLGQTVQTLANLGVLIGIIFLAVEIDQSTEATRASSRDAAVAQSLSFFEQRLDNQIIARAEYKRVNGEALDGLERYQLRSHQYFNFRTFENMYMNYENGLFSESEWLKYRDILVEVLEDNEIAMELWNDTPTHWSPTFRAAVSARMAQ